MSWRPPWQRPPEEDPGAREEASQHAARTAEMVRRLRDTRVARGLSTADVERDTRINRVYIDAIEDGRFSELPAPVYARGFVRSYARYLGLDPVDAVEAMPRDLPAPIGLQPMPGLRRTAAPVLPAINIPVAGAVAVAVALVVAAVFLAPQLAGESGVEVPGTATPGTTGTSALGAGGTPPLNATVPPFDEGTTPDFGGVTRDEAERVLSDLGVTPLIVEAGSQAPEGTVFDQSPGAGTPLQEGDVVTLFISQGS